MSDIDETTVPDDFQRPPGTEPNDDFQRPPGTDPNDDADREVSQTTEVIK